MCHPGALQAQHAESCRWVSAGPGCRGASECTVYLLGVLVLAR